MKIQTIKCKVIKNERGISFEVFKKTGMKKNLEEILLITAKPGALRGNHYHKKKQEWLGVIRGKARLVFFENKTHEKMEMDLSGDEPLLVKIPVNITHTIINTGKGDILILELSNHIYAKGDTDNYPNRIA
jgi:UDP-2-acetamido-2,6-beta-L-arabino-hexul-4-ose reductase